MRSFILSVKPEEKLTAVNRKTIRKLRLISAGKDFPVPVERLIDHIYL
jgi:hypothetical protein